MYFTHNLLVYAVVKAIINIFFIQINLPTGSSYFVLHDNLLDGSIDVILSIMAEIENMTFCEGTGFPMNRYYYKIQFYKKQLLQFLYL